MGFDPTALTWIHFSNYPHLWRAALCPRRQCSTQHDVLLCCAALDSTALYQILYYCTEVRCAVCSISGTPEQTCTGAEHNLNLSNFSQVVILTARMNFENHFTMNSMFFVEGETALHAFADGVGRARCSPETPEDKFHIGGGIHPRPCGFCNYLLLPLLSPLQLARGTVCPYFNTPRSPSRPCLPLERCFLVRYCIHSRRGPPTRNRDTCHLAPFYKEASKRLEKNTGRNAVLFSMGPSGTIELKSAVFSLISMLLARI